MKLPAGGYATSATSEAHGRQLIVIACGGGKMGTKSGDANVGLRVARKISTQAQLSLEKK